MNVRICGAPVKTGEVSLVKVQYREGLANHSGPESCTCIRKAAGEALTGERASRVLSRENLTTLRSASAVTACEGQHRTYRKREVRTDSARSETSGAHRNTSYGNREIPRPTSKDGSEVRAENPKGVRRR